MNDNKLKVKELKEKIELLERDKNEYERRYKKLLFMFQPEYYRILYPQDTDEDIKNIVGLFKQL